MSQVLSSQAGPADAVREYDEVRRVVELFLDGESKGDAAKLREASHPDARMFGSVGGTRYDMPIAEFVELAVKEPGDTGNHRARVVSVKQTGDAAVAEAAEEGYWGSLSFVDHFQLARIDGTWKVVSKLFAHTGGDVPAST
ncbi:nuclear transport factor 2 family protein [Geodermatophilus sp. YIM 151500]|uniref:nuclear transport factor 2 family protein n=1 Tax=Geodermatophilus sp. YIM 151500 TaxID=2984531 RepID=UPI0021E4520A|nr:nuclear transport factor 2 family protein [Geodermatophilus sp. YIM 151500]MCV2491861.1 nuclear transport factor 2 family protein [Geodermatophilus sp. YIM 151500]